MRKRLLLVVLSIFVTEVLTMLTLPTVLPHASVWTEALVDASVLSIVVALALWFLVVGRLRSEAEESLAAQASLLAAQASQLAEARDAALASASVKSEFLANMSHEIRNPMNGVLGMSGLLVESNLDAEQRGFAQAIQRSAEALLEIVNDILDFSKIEAGKLAIEPLSFDLRVAVEEVVALLAPRAHEKGIELLARTSPELPRYVVGDAGRIRQILTNLAGNAVKFTGHGHVLINVEIEAGPGGRIRFSVEDSGIGIPADRLDAIFDRFTQADVSTSPKFGGSGLGLSICRQLAELMHGHVGVASVPGQGSTFWVVLPLPADPDARPLRAPEVILADIRALIVEPDATSRHVLMEQLDGRGLRVSAVASGEEALAELGAADGSHDAYGMVLLTAELPDMEGETLGRLIKADARLHPAVLLYFTPMGEPGDARRIRDCGFAAYLLKPCRQEDLHDAVALAWETRGDEGPVPLITRHSLAESRAAERPGRAPGRGEAPAQVLVVEDNGVNQKLAVRLLEKLGCRADVAGNGREGVDMLGSRPYELILMDCQMPEMDGYEATRQIRASETPLARVPIVAMTASAMRGDREKCLAAGMDDYISKPIRSEDLAAVVERWIGVGATPAKVGSGSWRTGEFRTVELSPLDQLRSYDLSGGPTLVEGLCRLFLTDTARRLGALSAAVIRGDAEEVHLIAHTVKGSAWLVGARQMGAVAEDIEHQAGSGLLRRAAEQSARLQQEFERLRPFYELALATAARGEALPADFGLSD